MEDYPRTLLQLESRFRTDAACREYLAALRWPQGFVCPRCGAIKGWRTRRGLWMCGACQYQVSATAGTVFQDTHLPLGAWGRRRAISDETPRRASSCKRTLPRRPIGRNRLDAGPSMLLGMVSSFRRVRHDDTPDRGADSSPVVRLPVIFPPLGSKHVVKPLTVESLSVGTVSEIPKD